MLNTNFCKIKIQHKLLALKSIDLSDHTFVISYGFGLSALRESITKIGLTTPPLVKKGLGGDYQVVCGYKRLVVCQAMGAEDLTCAVMENHMEDKDALLVSLYDNLSHRDLNVIEKSIAIGKLRKYYTDEIIVKDFLPLLELPSHCSVLQRLAPLADLEGEVRDAIVEGKLDEKAALKLLCFRKNDRLLVFRLLYALRLSRNKQTEIIDYVHDVTQRDGCSVSDILGVKRFQDVLDDKDLNIPQKGGRVRELLRKLRYPKIVKAEKDFLEMKKGLNLGDNIRLVPPPFFEGDTYSINFQFRTINELEENLNRINSIKHNKGFKRTMEG